MKFVKEKALYKVFTNNTFHGHWPVGSAAVVVAESAEAAAFQLEVTLALNGLYQSFKSEEMVEVDLDIAKCYILWDGNY